MRLAGFLIIAILLSPFLLFVLFSIRDRMDVRRDQRIEDRCQHIAHLFEDVSGPNHSLARTFLESHRGGAYPYDLFMIEYRGGIHVVDTIWLPVRDFLTASDDDVKQVLADELQRPGKYTIPDWQEAVYQYVMHGKQDVKHKATFSFSALLRKAGLRS
jgi:hypothetical protein